MSDTSTVEAPVLPAFEGIPVVGAAMVIKDAGDGLSDALSVSPVALHHGDTGVLVLRFVVQSVNHKPDNPKRLDGPLVRHHTLKTTGITMVNAGPQRDQLEAQLREDADRVQAEIERVKGIQRMDDALTCPAEDCGLSFETMDELVAHGETHDAEDDAS